MSEINLSELFNLTESNNELVVVNALNDEHWVTKNNELIESTYSLTLQQQRILLILASRIQPKDDTFKLYQFNTKDIIEILGLSTTSGSYYTQIKKIVNDLQTKKLTIKKENRETNYVWVITADYFPKEGYFQVELHPKLRPFFLQLKDKFTKYRLENVLKLNSPYAIRLYELLKQYEGIGSRKFGVDELKDLLAIEPGKYKQYGHFKTKILVHSQLQIEKHTDLRFDFTEIKTGRKITRLEFHIKSKRNVTIEIADDDINKRMIDLGVATAQIQKIRSSWDDVHIRRNLEYTEEQVEKKKIENPAGYFRQALLEDYGQESEQENDDNEQVRKLKHLDKDGTEQAKEKYDKSLAEYETKLLGIIDLQRSIGIEEDIIQKNVEQDITSYCSYQLEHYDNLILPNDFSDKSLASYCSKAVNMV